MAFKNRPKWDGPNIRRSLQLTMTDAMEKGEVDEDSPLWILVFPDGRCVYRNSNGQVVPALVLSQVFSEIQGLTIEHYDVDRPFQMPGIPGFSEQVDEENELG